LKVKGTYGLVTTHCGLKSVESNLKKTKQMTKAPASRCGNGKGGRPRAFSTFALGVRIREECSKEDGERSFSNVKRHLVKSKEAER